MTTAALNMGEVAAFWRIARRLYLIYAELYRTFEIPLAPCRDLDYPSDRSEPEVMQRVRDWFDQMDARVQVWQLRQLLQSTTLQTEENLRDLIARYMFKEEKTETDRDKVDFLLVQYFAHCAPHGLYEQKITLDEVARVLGPVLGEAPLHFPEWGNTLDSRLEQLYECTSLEDLQDSGALVEVRELKLAAGQQYFEPGCLITFTRFNFLARRAFFRAMHLDLHAIREAVNELEGRGFSAVDCTEAGLSDRESLEHLRHVIHQWKTPFRAPYSGGSSFLQLIQLRHVLSHALDEVRKDPTRRPPKPQPESPANAAISDEKAQAPAMEPAISRPMEAPVNAFWLDDKPSPSQQPGVKPAPKEKLGPVEEILAAVIAHDDLGLPEFAIEVPPEYPAQVSRSANAPQVSPEIVHEIVHEVVHEGADVAVSSSVEAVPVSEPALLSFEPEPDDEYLRHCIADIAAQVKSMPAKVTPSATMIVLAGCRLLIATWEAAAFTSGSDPMSKAIRGMVAARTILQVSIQRLKKEEPADVPAALEIARQQIEQIRGHIASAREARNVDAAVNLAATTKRLLSLIEQGEKLIG
jgi:hypothetical protein